MGSDEPPLSEAGVFNFLRHVAATAVGGGGIGAEERPGSCFGMASRTLRVPRKGRVIPLGIKVVTKGAVRSKTGLGIYANLGVNVLRV